VGTRSIWKPAAGTTQAVDGITMRPKEEENDYRYFPEPDLPPLQTTPEWLAEIRGRLPELPAVRPGSVSGEFRLSEYDTAVLVNESAATALFEEALAAGAEFRQSCWPTG